MKESPENTLGRKETDFNIDKIEQNIIEAYGPVISQIIIDQIESFRSEKKDEDIVKFIAEIYLMEEVNKAIMLFKDNLEVADKVIWRIGDIAVKTRNKDAVKFVAEVFSMKKVKEAIMLFKDNLEVAEEVIWVIEFIALETRNKDAVKFVAEVFSMKKVKEAIMLFKDNLEVAEEVIWGIRYVAQRTGDKKTALVIVKLAEIYEDTPEIAGKIFRELGDIARETEDKDAVNSLAEVFSMKKVKEAIMLFKDNSKVAEEVIWNIGYVIWWTGDKKTALVIVKLADIYKDDPEIVGRVFHKIGYVAMETENKDAVKFIAEVFSMKKVKEAIMIFKDNLEVADKVIWKIGDIAMRTEDKDIVLATAKLAEIFKDNPEVAERVIYEIGDIAVEAENKDAVKFVAEVFPMEEVRRTIIMLFKDNIRVANKVILMIGYVAMRIRNKDMILVAVKLAYKLAEIYKDYPEIAEKVFYEIGYVAWETENKDAVKFVAEVFSMEEVKKVIELYKDNPIVSEKVIEMIGRVASMVKDIDVVKKVVELFYDVKLTKYIVRNDISAETLLKHYDLVKGNGIEGIKIIIIGKELEIDPNLNNFRDIVDKKLKNIGIEYSEKLTYNEILNIVRSYERLYGKERENFIKVVNNILGSDNKISCWIYERSGEAFEDLNISEEELIKYFVISLIGSRDKNKEKEAIEIMKKIESETKINSAKGFIRSSKKLVKEILDLYKQNNLDGIIEELEKFKGCQDLHDLVRAVRGFEKKEFVGRYLVGFDGKHIVSMFSDYSTMCCALLPEGGKEYASVLYQLDDRILLINYAFVDKLKKGEEIEAVREKGEIDGLVIGYKCLYDGKNTLLVDSVEGGRAFRNYVKNNFASIRNDIKEVAKNHGCKYVIYNTEVGNLTSQKFINKLREKGYSDGEYEIEMIGRKKQKHYLEAFGDDWNIPRGKINGIKVDLIQDNS